MFRVSASASAYRERARSLLIEQRRAGIKLSPRGGGSSVTHSVLRQGEGARLCGLWKGPATMNKDDSPHTSRFGSVRPCSCESCDCRLSVREGTALHSLQCTESESCIWNHIPGPRCPVTSATHRARSSHWQLRHSLGSINILEPHFAEFSLHLAA